MKKENQNFYSVQDSLSNIELFYSLPENIFEKFIFIKDDEFNHLIRVMRHKIGDEIYITDGEGIIYRTELFEVDKNSAKLNILSSNRYENKFSNIIVCIPQLRSDERLEFALEKCIELGITNFVIFKSERTIQKKTKIERLKKISNSAMKQSLQSYLPKIEVVSSFHDLTKLIGYKIIFEQNSDESFSSFLKNQANKLRDTNGKILFIFGPEGGLTDEEIISCKDAKIVKLNNNRLRTETAIITAVSIFTNI